jgi:hypothetical protein
VAGNLRYFADRFGTPRASIEGTQLPERAIRRYARRGAPEVVFERLRRRSGLVAVHRVTYFGFLLERDTEPLPDPFPPDLAAAARAALVDALLAGITPHPDQGRVRRAFDRYGFYWRRSGGRLPAAAPERLAAKLGEQIRQVGAWDEFINARIALDVEADIPQPVRAQLEALPSSLHLLGDRIPVEYEVEKGNGVVQVRLKEGQARRLRNRDLPAFDRPLRFIVLRGKREVVRAETVEDLQRQLSGLSQTDRKRPVRGGRRHRHR